MNHLALLVCLLAACKKKEKETPPPPPPVVADAAVAAPTIDAAVVIDAAPAAKLVLTREGIGPLQRLMWASKSEDEVAKTIQDALAPLMPDIKTSFDVMDVPGEVEREEGYWSVKRGDKELVMVLRDHGTGEDDRPATMMVWTPDIPTEDGIKVGDTVATVLEKHPNLYCFNDPSELIVQTVAADNTCHDKDAPGILYVLDAKKKQKRGEIKPASVKDVAIVALVAIPK